MEIFNNHKKLYKTAFLLFATLTLFVAIVPAINNQRNNKVLPTSEPLSEEALHGKALFIENGCVACHTQQVRNVDMDKTWGSRPGIAADYAANTRISTYINTATLMGTERTGPDLTNVGNRQPSLEWNLLHLYQPRAVVGKSIMPSYKWLFDVKENPSKNDVVVNVPAEFMRGVKGKVVTTKDALDLVAYLQSLKQAPLPDGTQAPEFLYKQKAKSNAGNGDIIQLDGQALYAANCQSCHQENGEGLKGAFPALKGSSIVQDVNPELLINVIMKGYNPREEFGVMPAIGTNNNLTAEEVAAIINHERTSWGNKARKVSVDEVVKIIGDLQKQDKNQ
jgi:cytochrome c oxidase cbb3-type subunit 2